MQGWTWTLGRGSIFGEKNPHFHCGFIPNSATQAQGFRLLGCICSFPLSSQSVAARPRGSRSHLIPWMGFYRTHHKLQGTKVPKRIKKAPELAVGENLVLASVQWHSSDWAGVCTMCFVPRAMMQLPLDLRPPLLTVLNLWHRSDIILAVQALDVNPIFPMESFVSIAIFDDWCSSSRQQWLWQFILTFHMSL